MSKHKHKSALGRGLSSLLGEDTATSLRAQETNLSIGEVALNMIEPNPNQPRREFDEDKLDELATSIRSLGLVQPITLQTLESGRYMLISGERRWRAAQLAGLQTIPAYIRKVTQEQILEMALVENIQREDLNPIEIALSYQQLLDNQPELTHATLAEKLGKGRTSVTNYLRLLRLPSEIQLGLTERLLEMGHARALLQVDDTERQLELYQIIIQDKLSVREVEELAKALQNQSSIQTEKDNEESQSKSSKKNFSSQEFKALESQLAKVFSTKVSLRCSATGKGKLTIPFANDEELEKIIVLLERLQHE